MDFNYALLGIKMQLPFFFFCQIPSVAASFFSRDLSLRAVTWWCYPRRGVISSLCSHRWTREKERNTPWLGGCSTGTA